MKNIKEDKIRAVQNISNVTLNLKITDFGKQTILDVNTITSQLKRLPRFHLKNLKQILYDPDRYTPKIIDCSFLDARAQGIYVQSHQLIVIFELHNLNQLLHVLFHEIGHHVYFRIITQQLKVEWVKDICRNDKFITEYASRNAAEDFAESYSCYFLQPNKLKKIPLKYSFLKNHVFEDAIIMTTNNRLDFKA